MIPLDEPSCTGLRNSGALGLASGVRREPLSHASSERSESIRVKAAFGIPLTLRTSLVRALWRQSASVNGSLPE